MAVAMQTHRILLLLLFPVAACGGCAAFPDIVHEPQYRNPFPQLSRVAVCPFYNLSSEPTVNQDRFAEAYFNELQRIPGFEVVPVGVVRQVMQRNGLTGSDPDEFPELARLLGVDAVVVGAVTDYTPYYPPRLTLVVDWYAANPGFHPIPPGYGLPWGTPEEEFIPQKLVDAAEFALAREQLKSQTPRYETEVEPPLRPAPGTPDLSTLREIAAAREVPASTVPLVAKGEAVLAGHTGPKLPEDWPDPRGFVPPPPRDAPPPLQVHRGPILNHVRTYNGHDSEFTTALAHHYYLSDDARYGGWQAYMQRSDDFIRFCCRLHITEMLAARGGVGETRVLWRWPVSRYER